MLARKRLPVTAILGTSLFLIGISAASVAPYRGVVAIDTLGISNQTYALILTVSSVGTALASLVLGYFADRIRDRRILVIICATFGAFAYGLIYLSPTQFTYILALCVILPFGGALFSQCFSFSRAYYNQRRPERAEFMMSALRTLFAVSWVVMPPIAGWIAATYSVFDVFAAAALAHVACTLIFGLLLVHPDARIGTPTKKEPGAVAERLHIPTDRIIGMGGVTMIRMAMALHATALPLALLNDFDGSLTDVGINASIAAGLEVPCMLAWGLAASRLSKETILVVNAAIYALYQLLLLSTNSVADVFWLQGLNAIATAALLSITISYMQDAIKGRVGLSTSLMDVISVVSTALAATTFATFASEGSYTLVFAAASTISLAAAITLAISRFLRIARDKKLAQADGMR